MRDGERERHYTTSMPNPNAFRRRYSDCRFNDADYDKCACAMYAMPLTDNVSIMHLCVENVRWR